MYAFQIDKILKSNKFSKKYFLGVYPSDKIPPIRKYPSSFIVNTDKEGGAGLHWIAIFIINPERAEFFDSFGRQPTGPIKNFLSSYKFLVVNTKKLQVNYEISCGPFVIYYVINRSRGKSMDRIINDLKKRIFSDAFVKIYAAYLVP